MVSEALLAVLEQRTVTNADVDKLLAVRGVEAMVDNTTKYIPSDSRDTFRAALKGIVATRRSTVGHFELEDRRNNRRTSAKLIAELKANSDLVVEVAGSIDRYMHVAV
ncbi:MAG: hypothetical protein JWO97_2145 [Acidobacteria bacterium]|nr:hypothetical protein [Acidobacteriota bacterium]